ncbi:MAG: sigma-70 family RNA polymerase sigma factor [Planctomycetes bacterium]|nr:sigma-70 family RNA polymerase sigma factor [Planctomycetota bacterium]
MNDSSKTRLSLLLRVRNSHDDQAWNRFVTLYTPLIYRFAKRSGLQDADAADVTQEVFRTVTRSIKQFDYNSRIGSFRGWLKTVTRSRIYDFQNGKLRQPVGTGDTAVHAFIEQQTSQADDEFWEQEYQKRVFDLACETIRDEFTESIWQAFWQTAVEGIDTKQTSAQLGLSTGAIYIAKSRVIARLKQEIQNIEAEENQ